jgi:hypothetical protein
MILSLDRLALRRSKSFGCGNKITALRFFHFSARTLWHFVSIDI